jgi:poly-gamma-glutamate synthesis protein (capsule biosynthesis protein)
LGTRQQFIDRLVFYDGRLLNIDLRTAMLEEYGRPRPMTSEERRAFLAMILAIRP